MIIRLNRISDLSETTTGRKHGICWQNTARSPSSVSSDTLTWTLWLEFTTSNVGLIDLLRAVEIHTSEVDLLRSAFVDILSKIFCTTYACAKSWEDLKLLRHCSCKVNGKFKPLRTKSMQAKVGGPVAVSLPPLKTWTWHIFKWSSFFCHLNLIANMHL